MLMMTYLWKYPDLYERAADFLTILYNIILKSERNSEYGIDFQEQGWSPALQWLQRNEFDEPHYETIGQSIWR